MPATGVNAALVEPVRTRSAQQGLIQPDSTEQGIARRIYVANTPARVRICVMTTTRIHAAPVEQVNVRSRHPGFVDADSAYRHVVRRLRPTSRTPARMWICVVAATGVVAALAEQVEVLSRQSGTARIAVVEIAVIPGWVSKLGAARSVASSVMAAGHVDAAESQQVEVRIVGHRGPLPQQVSYRHEMATVTADAAARRGTPGH